MRANIEQLEILLREFVEGAKHGVIYSEHVKFRVYTYRLLTALDCISDTCSDLGLLSLLLESAESVACVRSGMVASPVEHNRHPSDKAQRPADENAAAQLCEVGRYLVMDCINRLFQRGSEVGEHGKQPLFPIVFRSASLLRDLAPAPLTRDGWETDISIFWDYLVPLLPVDWHRTSQVELLRLMLHMLTDGLQFLPASEDMLCSILKRLDCLCHEKGEVAEPEVCDMVIHWVTNFGSSFAKHGVPNAFVSFLERWLVRLGEECTDPRVSDELYAVTASLKEAAVTVLIDTGNHSLALEHLGCEQDPAQSGMLSPFQVCSAVQCMLVLKRSPWKWIKTLAAVDGHCLVWADVLRACICDCQCMGSLQQANALKGHLGQLQECVGISKLVDVADEMANQLFNGFPLMSDATELAEHWVLKHLACHHHHQTHHQELHHEALDKLVPIMMRHAESLRQARLWSRAAHLFESAHLICDLQQDNIRQQSLLRARVNQCMLCWVATDQKLTKEKCKLIMEKAGSACSQLKCGRDVVSTCYWMMTCLVCKNEPGAQDALNSMILAEGIASEHVFCLEQMALKQAMMCTVFDLRCLGLNLQLHSPSVDSLLETVALGIKAITQCPRGSTNRAKRVAACSARCHQLMLLLADKEAPSQPCAVVQQALTSACLLIVQGSAQADLSLKQTLELCSHLLSVCATHPAVGIESIFCVLKVISTAVGRTKQAAGKANVQMLNPVIGDLYFGAAAAMQSLILFTTEDESCNLDHANLPVLVNVVLGELLQFEDRTMCDPESKLLRSRLEDSMQIQLCEVLDCIEEFRTVASNKPKPAARVDCSPCHSEHMLHQLVVVAAAIISWFARNARTADWECTLCSCMHAFKEVLPLECLTKEGRAQVSMHLGDVASTCLGQMYDHKQNDRELHDNLHLVAACALAFPGVQQQVGLDTCSELRTLACAKRIDLDPPGLRCSPRNNGGGIEGVQVDAESLPAGAQPTKGRLGSPGTFDVPAHALLFL